MSSSTPFNPAPPLEAKILDAIVSEHHSLISIAALAATTTEALSLWIARPDIRDRLAALESTAAYRIRLSATFHLDNSIAAIIRILQSPTLNALAFPNQSSDTSPHSQPATQPSPSQPRHSELGTPHSPPALRAAESIRRAASTLIRLSRFKPIGPTAPISADSRAPRLSQQPTAAAPPLRNDLPLAPHHSPTPLPTPLPARPQFSNSTLAAFLDSHRDRKSPSGGPSTQSPQTPGRKHSPAHLNPAASLLQSAGSARGP